MLSRREFTAALGAASSYSTARGYAAVRGANDRLHIGVIGCGGMAGNHMKHLMNMIDSDNVRIASVCDIYDKRLEAAAGQTKGNPVKDYRTVLDDKNIDYVLIATPEHWHAQMILDAAAAGKHMYCEKPMTRTVDEAREVVEKLRESPVKAQIGVQGTSDESYVKAYEYVKDGTLGNVVLAQIDYSRNNRDDIFPSLDPDRDAKPGVNLDWKAWLGPAPKRPFDPDRFYAWRRYWDYSAGIASDLFVHRVTRFIKALNLTFPEYGAGFGGKFEFRNTAAEVPDTMNILLDYPQGLTVQLISSMANDTAVDHLLRGHKATLQFTRTGFEITPQALFKEQVKPVAYKKKGAEDIRLHHRNLMNAIRKNEALNCDYMTGFYGVAAVEMGVESLRQRKYMRWDKAKQRVVRA